MSKTKNTIVFQGQWRQRRSGAGAWTYYPLIFTSSEKISFSTGHAGWRELGSKGYDVGGPVLIEKTLLSPQVATVQNWDYEGAWCPNAGSAPVPSNPSTTSLIASGTTGIARCTPTTPAFGIATSAAELVREGLPRYIGSSLLKEKVRLAKSAGDEYLNYQFGWAPIVRDLRKFAYVVKHHNRIISNYVKGSGRKIQRRYEFPGSTTNGSGSGITSGTPTVNAYYQFQWTKTDSLRFSGAFRYHVPLSSEGASRLAEFESKANHLLGVRLTPEVVWNLSPWSWAADWFGNVGDVMHNISTLGHDGLVMQYGYIASKSEVVKHVQSQLYASRTYTSSCTQVSSVYTRLGASPFGFGLSPLSLSLKQQAIVAALGLSKGGKWLP